MVALVPNPQPKPPRIDPVHLPELQSVATPPARSDIRELERYADVDLSDADLRFASFTECEFRGLWLSGSRWDGTRLRQVHLAELDAAALSAPRGDWREVHVSGSRIGSAELYDSTWTSITVTGSKISYLNARAATWSDVVFRDCVLDELDLSEATVRRLAFSSVRIGTLTTTGATLTDVDLRGVTLSVVKGLAGLAGAWIDDRQLLDFAPLLAGELGIRVTDLSGVGGAQAP